MTDTTMPTPTNSSDTPQDSKTPAQPLLTNDQQAPVSVASPWLRLLALLYDGMLILALCFLVSTVLIVVGTNIVSHAVGSSGADASTLPAWYRHLVIFPSMVATLVWFYGMFWRRSGQTLGMQTWRLLTLRMNGELLTWRHSILRCLSASVLPFGCAVLSFLAYGNWKASSMSLLVGFLCNYAYAFFNPHSLALHDMLSRTYTIKIAPRQAGVFADLKNKLGK